MASQPVNAHLGRETVKSVLAALVGATVPVLTTLWKADAAVVHAVCDVAIDLGPVIFLNALMSALIPVCVTLRRRAPQHWMTWSGLPGLLVRPMLIVLGLAVGGTILTLGAIHLTALAFSLDGLAAIGVMVVRGVQAALVAAILTPLAITLISRAAHVRA